MRFSYFLGQWMRQSWDHLGHLILISSLFVVTAAVSIAPLLGLLAVRGGVDTSVFIAGGLLGAGIFLGLWGTCLGWLSFHRSVDRLLEFQDFSLSDYLECLRKYIWKSLWFTLFLGGAGTILLFNWTIYPHMFSDQPLLRAGAIAITGWMLLFLAMVQTYLVAFLAHQECDFGIALKRALKVSFWKPFRAIFLVVLEILTSLLFFPPLCFILPGVLVCGNQLSLMILLEDWKDPYERTPEAIRAGV